MAERPRCDLGHELDFIGHNHVEPDEIREHYPPSEVVERLIARRKAYILQFRASRQ